MWSRAWFSAIPYDDREDILRGELQRMIDYCTPEGMLRLAEREKLHTPPPSMPPEELESLRIADEAGWAKAKSDIDWIDESRKYSK